MLARVAENIYWMARYVERAENLARIINIHTHLLLDLPRGARLNWESLLLITGSRDAFYKQYKEADERSVMRFLIVSDKHAGSILSALANARENMRTTRDIIPPEAFETINNLYLNAKENLSACIPRKGRYRFLEDIIRSAQLNSGLLAGTMMHDTAYSFIRLGRNLERADMTTRILDVGSVNLVAVSGELTPFKNIQWLSILKSLTAYQMYRRYAHSRVTGMDVLKFVLHNPKLPRSVLHCLKEVEGCLETLPRRESALTVMQQVKSTLMGNDFDTPDHGLREYMDELQIGVANIHDQIELTYFIAQSSSNQATQSQANKPLSNSKKVKSA